MKTRIGVIGTGWRAGFFLRAAKMLPQQFEVCGVVYHSEAGKERAGAWGVPLFASPEQLVQETKPDYVVVSVSRKSGVARQITAQLAEMGVPVLMETPPADSLEDLTEFYKQCGQAKIQVAEQYQFQPMIAARLAVAASGQIGQVYQTQFHLPNGYHSISVHRKALGVGMALPKVWGAQYVHQRMSAPGRDGDPVSEEMISVKQMVFHLHYGEKQAFNDLEGDQCRAWIRREHYNIRGDRGEVYDDEVYYMEDFLTPVHYSLERMMTGAGTNLEGSFLRGVRGQDGWVYENPFRPARMFDDEIAVATCMQKMAEYVQGGPDFYSLAEAMQDRYLALLTVQSAKEGKVLEASPQIWMK